jgi:hypothetical protein
MEVYFNQLQTICNLKEGVSPRDDNERQELLYLLRLLRLEIEAIPEPKKEKEEGD